MKRFCLFLICILIAPIMLVGCNEDRDDGFVEVQSITYTYAKANSNYNSDSTTISSRYYIDVKLESVTVDEYNLASKYLNDYEYENYINSTTINTEKSNIPNISDTKLQVGEAFYQLNYTDSLNPQYYKVTIIEFKVVYLKVKILQNNLIEIIDNNSHYLIQTTSLKINYFV
ncbi:MAG: hypothetical protein ACI4PF_04890 [Christensenellales bacterium]